MKAYSNLEQSRILAEILSFNSADMKYPYFGDGQYGETALFGEPIEFSGGKDVPCWSLAALLDYLAEKDCFPEVTYTGTCYLMDINFYDDEEGNIVHPIHFIRTEGESLVDACVEMILKLHEQKLL